MKKLNVAIIGQGRSGYDIHGAYLKTDDAKQYFNVVAVVDRLEARREQAKNTWGCDTYCEYTELLDRKDIDVVVNASFSKDHYPITKDLLAHGFNVISEKPFSRYAAECEDMIKTAKENNVMLTVFQQSRLAPYYTKVKEVLDSGVLGKVHHISIKYSGFSRRWDWQCSQRYYGGGLLNSGPHPMDQALDLLDTDDMPQVFSVLRNIHSRGDAEDYAKVILTYPDRPVIDVEVCTADAYNDRIFTVYAENGSLKASGAKIEYKYIDQPDFPELDLETLVKDDGVSAAYCKENYDWKVVEEEITGTAFDAATALYYKNIYDHLTEGAPLVIKPEKILQQIRIAELIHAQNPMPVLY